jgi:hypothetical protein
MGSDEVRGRGQGGGAQAQHQIHQLKWEARFSQMEQQQAARAYNIQPLSTPLQYAAGTMLPLAPQKERLVQLQLQPPASFLLAVRR